MNRPLLVTAWLSSPLAGEAPQLDGLLECAAACRAHGDQDAAGVPRHKVDRALPAPPMGVMPVPLAKCWFGRWLVYAASSPIVPKPGAETVEHINKRIATEAADLLVPSERKIVTTTNTWTKSYRLPLRVRAVPCVRWFCNGNRREILKLLRNIHGVGKKVADGYGRISKWEASEADDDYSLYARHDAGAVLMRPLPDCPMLPKGLLGYRIDFGACTPPYWHPERYTDILAPC